MSAGVAGFSENEHNPAWPGVMAGMCLSGVSASSPPGMMEAVIGMMDLVMDIDRVEAAWRGVELANEGHWKRREIAIDYGHDTASYSEIPALVFHRIPGRNSTADCSDSPVPWQS